MSELRLLPLLASGTEIVHALGLGELQVGRSHECDFPECVASLPVCTAPAFAVDGSSRDIDTLVKCRLSSALSLYSVDAALIAKLQPTHIITQTQCRVCAVSLSDVELALQRQTGTNAQVISLEPFALRDLWADILRVGTACGHTDRAHALVDRLQARMAHISSVAAQATHRPRVGAIEWLDPLMAAGNWVPKLIEMAGGENLFGRAGQHSPWMTWDDLIQADPGIIIALPCGFDLDRIRSEMHCLTAHPAWPNLSAVRNHRVYLCDGSQYMNRPGPRLVESLQIFAEILHPELFPPSMKHSAWDSAVPCST